MSERSERSIDRAAGALIAEPSRHTVQDVCGRGEGTAPGMFAPGLRVSEIAAVQECGEGAGDAASSAFVPESSVSEIAA